MNILAPRHSALLDQAADYCRSERYDEAIEILEQLRERYTDHRGIAALLLHVALSADDSDRAFELARQLQDEDLSPEMRLRVGWAFSAAGFPALGLNQVNIMRADGVPPDVEPDLEEFEHSIRADLKAYPPAISRGGNSFAIAMRQERAEIAHRDKNYPEAVRLAEALAMNIPDLLATRLLLAQCYVEMGEIDRALAHATAARELPADDWNGEDIVAYCELLLGLPLTPIHSSFDATDSALPFHVKALVLTGDARAAEYIDSVSADLIVGSLSPGLLVMTLGFAAKAAGRPEEVVKLARIASNEDLAVAEHIGSAALHYVQIIPEVILENFEPPFHDSPRLLDAIRSHAPRFPWLPRLGEMLAAFSDDDGISFALLIYDVTQSAALAERLIEVASSDRFTFEFREWLAAELGQRGIGGEIAVRRKELSLQFAWGTLEVFDGPLPGETPEILAALNQVGALCNQGRTKRAHAVLQQTIEQNGETAQLRNAVSQALLAAEDFEGAYDLWLDIADRFPEDATSRLRLAECAFEQGDIARAEELARSIFSIGTIPLSTVSALASLLMNLGVELNELQVAEEGLQYLQANAPDDPELVEDLQEWAAIIAALVKEQRTGRRKVLG